MNRGLFSVEVCLSPALLDCYDTKDKIVVVIDIFRASSAIVTGLSHGIESIIPVETLDEAYEYKRKGYIVAAERNGEIIKGFDFGNSPFSFMEEKLKNKRVVLTTTNCTKAIFRASEASMILIGSFLNIKSLADYINQSVYEDVVLLCAGWKNRPNLEDTLFAGNLITLLGDRFQTDCDSGLAAVSLYEFAKDDIGAYLKKSSHSHRLEHLNIGKDVDFCLQNDLYSTIPQFQKGILINLNSILQEK